MKKITSVLALILIPAALFAATVGDKMTFEGPVTFKGTVTNSGTTTQSGAQTYSNTVTLDDGSGASPSLVMTDATDESVTFSKVDAGFLTITTVAGDGIQVTTGNLKVGNGTPGVAQDGEDAYVEGTLEVDGAVTLDGAATVAGVLTANGNVTVGNAVTDNITFTGAIQGASPFILDGTTDNTNELTVTLGADPGSDLTLTIPATTSAAAMISSLTTNDVDAANSVTGASNALVFEGATANAYETSVTVVDPTADRTITIPNETGAVMMSSLATNGTDVADSVTGGTNQLVFEGATADAYETVIVPTDPTADRTVTLPDAGGVIMLSNAVPEGANAVWGTANGFYIEGATANNYETAIIATDPTADQTITFPDATGTVSMNCTASHDYGAAATDWTMTAAEAACSYITVTNASGPVNAILPAATPGKVYTVNNGSGQTLTFKVTAQTGGTVANTKWAFYTTGAADVLEVYELP